MSEEPLIGPVRAPALHVMSWNIRRRLPVTLRAADRWGHRAPRMRTLLQTEHPTVLTAQEALPEQLDFLRETLGGEYRSIGRGRDVHGGGEASPVLYDDRRLELLDWGQRALSDTPERPGSVSWGNVIPRILVVATFRDRTTGRRFLVANTHFDHLSRRSRVRSAETVLEVVSRSGLPAVVTGDFNDDADSATLDLLLSGGALVDTWRKAPSRRSGDWGTFPNYREPRRGGRRLDWILTTPEFRVCHAAINPRRPHGGWASDHLPVQAVLLLTRDGETS